MNCEHFESIGLDLDRESALDIDALERTAAIDHANTCARCAALQESWREARIELQALRDMTNDASAPARVEMRLRQEFFARNRAQRTRRLAIGFAWVLASAAMLLVGMNWWNWHITNENIPLQSANTTASAPNATPTSIPSNTESYTTEAANESTLVAANDAEDFTLLPGSMAQEAGDGSVVRVRMQRGALGDLGLPVNEERANEWIQVDLLVGQDGQPQAVRLPQAQ
jgi:hypothetical protein